jgi:hypothetical protein
MTAITARLQCESLWNGSQWPSTTANDSLWNDRKIMVSPPGGQARPLPLGGGVPRLRVHPPGPLQPQQPRNTRNTQHTQRPRPPRKRRPCDTWCMSTASGKTARLERARWSTAAARRVQIRGVRQNHGQNLARHCRRRPGPRRRQRRPRRQAAACGTRPSPSCSGTRSPGRQSHYDITLYN